MKNNLFIHVGKTGGSTIWWQYAKLFNIRYYIHRDLLQYYHEVLENKRPLLGYTGYNISNAEFTGWFTIIRNPITRVVSAFNMLKLGNTYGGVKFNDIISEEDRSYYMNKAFKEFDNASQLLEALSLDKNSIKYKNAIKILNMHHLAEGYFYIFSKTLGKNWLRKNAKKARYIAVIEEPNWFENMYLYFTGNKFQTNVKKLRKNNHLDKSLTSKAKLNYYNYAKDTEYKVLKEFVDLKLLDKSVYNKYIDFIYN